MTRFFEFVSLDMADELPVSPNRIPRSGVVKLLRRAADAHERALTKASDAVKHAVTAGELLCLAREGCAACDWQQMVTDHFPASLRTAQKYMRLARHFKVIQANSPQALSSQNQAAKALTAIMNGGQPDTPTGGSKRKRRARGASLIKPGPFFEMAIQTLRDVEYQLAQVRPDSFAVATALAAVRRGTSALLELSTASGEVRDEPVSGFKGGTGHAPHSANSSSEPRGDEPQNHEGESNA